MYKVKRGIRQSGSALIITVLLVTVLSSIALSTSRLTISEIVQSSQLEDSEFAYQAAEGCIELGLLRYRYDRDAELPADIPEGMSEKVEQFMYIDVINGKEIAIEDEEAFENIKKENPTGSYCALRMWHRNDSGEEEAVDLGKCTIERYNSGLCAELPETLVSDVCGNDKSSSICYTDEIDNKSYITPALTKNEAVEYSIEYDVTNLKSISLEWEYLEEPLSFNEFCIEYPDKCDWKEYEDKYLPSFQLLYIPIDKNGEMIMGYGYKELIDKNRGISGISKDLDNVSRIRIKPFGGNLKSYTIASDDPSTKLDSRYTTIEAVGYYGSAQRKLRNIIDRRTKTLLSTFDFMYYSHEE